MAKTFSDGIIPVSFFADTDLSSKQYYAVTAASTDDYVTTATGASNPVPLGILQEDAYKSDIGTPVSVKAFGFTKAVVAACDTSGNACTVSMGTYLQSGSDGKLYSLGTNAGPVCARSMDSLSTGSAKLNVFFFGSVSGCNLAAS